MELNDLKKANVPKVIPEISYDLICRIIPGAIVIGCMLWLFPVDITNDKPELLFGLFLILLAYVIGFIIDALATSMLNKCIINYSWKIISDNVYKTPEKLQSMTQSLGFDADINLADNKKIILEILREHVVTNFPYATSMMPKLNAEAALPKNLGASLVIVLILAVYCKIYGWICREWSLLIRLLPLLVAVEFVLFFAAKHRFRRTILRTVYWFQELQKQRETTT